MSHAGTAVSLSGLIDIRGRQWLMASRWLRMRGRPIHPGHSRAYRRPGRDLPQPRCRAQTAPPREPKLSRAVPCWCIGAGASGLAYAVDGRSLLLPGRRLLRRDRPLAHWCWTDARCGCGNTACLETGARARSLLPLLRQRWRRLGEDEARSSEQLSACDLLSLPEIDQAARCWRAPSPMPAGCSSRTGSSCQRPLRRQRAALGAFRRAVPGRGHVGRAGDAAKLCQPSGPNPHFAEIHGAAAALLSRAAEALLRGGKNQGLGTPQALRACPRNPPPPQKGPRLLFIFNPIRHRV